MAPESIQNISFFFLINFPFRIFLTLQIDTKKGRTSASSSVISEKKSKVEEQEVNLSSQWLTLYDFGDQNA